MTPADRAMMNAFAEGVEQARSPARATNKSRALFGEPSQFDFTSSEPRGQPASASVLSQLPPRPDTPRVTTQQFWRPQERSWRPSPDIDYKRVRRKQNASHLDGHSHDHDSWPLPNTSFSPLLPSTSLQNYFNPTSLPSPLTPHFRSSPTSPSLSSTVDTLTSTPPHTPFQYGEPPFGQRASVDRAELSEPIRTKRKFPQLKAAKRLPHSPAHINGGESVWEVHAAVIDVGAGNRLEYQPVNAEADAHVIEADQESVQLHQTGGKGRSVRFEDVSRVLDRASHALLPSEITRRTDDDNRTQTSGYSLSKFKFPAPPGYHWAGTFGHLDDTPSQSPASPATLHYRGVSFDVVNPHASLLLGYTDFETPAEIDGLLDDYFNISTNSLPMPYYGRNQGASSSQQSIQTSSSNGRTRQLFDDAESARRTIMNLPAAPPSDYDSPTIPTTKENRLRSIRTTRTDPLSSGSQTSPHGQQTRFGIPAGPSNLRHAESNINVGADGFEPAPVTTLYPQATADLRTRLASAVDRSSSIYPRSQRSNQFDLAVSECGGDNIDARIGIARSSYYASGEALDNEDAESPQDEESVEAQATQSTHGLDTVDNIYDAYCDSSRLEESRNSFHQNNTGYEGGSTNMEQPRGHGPFSNPFHAPYELAKVSSHPIYGGYENVNRTSRHRYSPPNMRLPTPQRPAQDVTGILQYPTESDAYPTDQPSANTAILFGTTPSLHEMEPYNTQSSMRRPPADIVHRSVLPRSSQESWTDTNDSRENGSLAILQEERRRDDLSGTCGAVINSSVDEMLVQEITRIVQDKTRSVLLHSRFTNDQSQPKIEQKRLKYLRSNYPAEHKRGIDAAKNIIAAEKAKSAKKRSLWSRVIDCLKRGMTSSDTERLLPPTHGETMMSGDEASTFQTSRPPVAVVRAGGGPLDTRPLAVVGPPVTHWTGSPNREDPGVELVRHSLTQSSRAAVSGQRRPFRLTLGERVSVVEWGERGWNRGGRVPLSSGFGIVQADGSVEHVSLLMNPRHARNLGSRRLQKQLTMPWLRVCGLFPVTAAMFGLGAFDGQMQRRTQGQVTEMEPAAKKMALAVYLPLGVIVYVAVGLMIRMIAVVLNR